MNVFFYKEENVIKFKTDDLWKEAKHLAKLTGNENNWIEVVSFYHELEGEHVQVYSSLDEGDRRRIIGPVDEDSNKVLTLTREGELSLDDYIEVEESKKTFIFTDSPQENRIRLPEGISILDETEIVLYE